MNLLFLATITALSQNNAGMGIGKTGGIVSLCLPGE